MEEFDERTCLCALNRIFGYQPAEGHRLLEAFGSAREVFEAGPKRLQEALDGGCELAAEVGRPALEWAVQELEKVQSGGARFLGYGEDDYPALLAECPDAPLGLYYKGTSPPAETFGFRPGIAIVGTRDASSYGREWCRRIVEALGRTDVRPAVVSGLAFGVDAAAHTAALDAGLPTVGVMATGIDKVYPWQHGPLAARIVKTPGCALVTDYPTGGAPLALNFIRRNRIIAGLARATVVVESRTKGGSLVTAKYANDYNRDVFALPGRADDLRSLGCNSLIANRMAEIITTPEALMPRLGFRQDGRLRSENLARELEAHYGGAPQGKMLRDLALLVKKERGIDLDELCRRTGLSYGNLLELTGILEADGFLKTDLLGRCSIVTKNG